MTRVCIETFDCADIPTMLISTDSQRPAPLVFYLHGFTADKTQGVALGYALAQAGLHVVSFDALAHGHRYDESLGALCRGETAGTYPHASGLDVFLRMHEIIVQTAADVQTLLTHLPSHLVFDPRRVGVTGFSMGGFASFYLLATNPHLAAAVPIAGIPTFAARWQDVVLEASSYPAWAVAMARIADGDVAARHRAFMQSIDPASHLETFYPRPVLIICGDRDLDSPKKYMVDFFRALQPHYAALPSALRLDIHDDAGHQLTPAMISATVAWFTLHLDTGHCDPCA